MSKSQSQITRVTRTKDEARASYNKMSRWYDIINCFEKKYKLAGLQMLDIKEGEVVFEIGFGTGRSLVWLARAAGRSGQVFGIDISEGMLAVAKSKLKRAGLLDRATLNCGDATKLPFKSNVFDAIYMSFTLELFDTPEIPVVLGECFRVLKAEGRIGVVAMSEEGEDGLMMRLYKWLHKRFPRLVDCRPIFVRQALEDAEFELSSTKKMSMWGLPVEIVVAKKRSENG